MKKFVYQVSNCDYDIIIIWSINRLSDLKKNTKIQYITKEQEIREYIKKYPHSTSLSFDKESKKEAQRLQKKYSLVSLQF